jgi:hypothetical protein
MACFSPKKPPVAPVAAADWASAATKETDAAKRLELLCATLDSIETNASDSSAALEACILVGDVSLGDVWSEARRACARGVAKVPLDASDRARLAAHFGSQLDLLTQNDDWRRYDGLCRALEQLCTRGSVSIVEEAHIVARKALSHAQPTVRQAAARVMASADASLLKTIATEREAWLREKGIDRERRAAALAGLLEGANVLIKNHAVVDFDIDATVALLKDAASTVRQGAAEQLQRLASKSVKLASRVVASISDASITDWRRAEGSLMTLDGVLSDEASRAMASYPDVDDTRATYRASLLKISMRWLQTTVRTDADEEPFEVRRAARQLAHSTARAEIAFVSHIPGAIALSLLQRGPDAVAARLLHHACSFLRFIDEALMDAQRTPRGRRWGLSHEGAGGDSESVEQSERAVSRAVLCAPEKLSERIEAFRPLLLECVRLIQEHPAPVEDARAEPKASPLRTPGGTYNLTASEELHIEERLVIVRGLALCIPDGAICEERFGAFFRVDMRDPGSQWFHLARAPSELRRLAEPALCEFVACLRHPEALAEVGPHLVDWLLALEGNQRGDRERPTSRKHVAEALCVLLRGSLCVFQPTNRVTDHACSLLRTVFRAAAFAAERETFAVALGEKTGVPNVARAASSIIQRLAPAWGRVRRVDGEAAARLAALCALAAAVCSIDATHLRAALASLVQACPGQATPPRTPVKAPRPLSPLGLGPPETPVTPLSPHAAEPIDDWDDWDDDEVEEPVVASSAGLAALVDAVRAELGAEASAPRLSFF